MRTLNCRSCESQIQWPTADERKHGWFCPFCDIVDPADYSQEDFISILQQELEELQIIVTELQEQVCGKLK